jgi:hypothetical protein
MVQVIPPSQSATQVSAAIAAAIATAGVPYAQPFSPSLMGSSQTPGANVAVAQRVRFTETTAITRFRWWNGGTADANVTAGLFRVNGTNYELVCTTAATAQGAAINQEQSAVPTTTFNPIVGVDYWVAISLSNGTGLIGRAMSGSIAGAGNLGAGAWAKGTLHPLATTAISGVIATGTVIPWVQADQRA